MQIYNIILIISRKIVKIFTFIYKKSVKPLLDHALYF